MSADFIARLIGMIAFSIFGVYLGTYLGRLSNVHPGDFPFTIEQYAFTIGLVGALTGLILTPFITTRPIRAFRSLLGRISPQALFSSLLGLIVGLIVAALLSFPLSLLPVPFGRVMPFIGVIVLGYMGISVFVMRQNDLFSMISSFRGGSSAPAQSQEGGGKSWAENRTILLDTSVIIDGRIADIART